MQSTTIWMCKPSWQSSLSQKRKCLGSVSHPFKVSLLGLEMVFIAPFFLSVAVPLHKKEPVQSNHYHHVLCKSLHLIANIPLKPSWWSNVMSAEHFGCLCLAHSAWPIGLHFYFYFNFCITIPEIDTFQVIWQVLSTSWLFYYFLCNAFCMASFAHHHKHQRSTFFLASEESLTNQHSRLNVS